MLTYNSQPISTILFENVVIASFVSDKDDFTDKKTIESFGDEWKKFNSFEDEEIKKIGSEYFDIVSENELNNESVVLDLGCGSGRWSRYIADKVKYVEAIDPSEAVYTAAKLNQDKTNFRITRAGVDNIPFADESFDLIICLGVLHHLPNTADALKKAADKLKHNGHFLLYLYYKLDNRGKMYKFIFRISSSIRKLVSILPSATKHFVCDCIAILVYMPLIVLARVVKNLFSTKNYYHSIPLSYYVNKSFAIIRNDALDRFGTPLEQRFSKDEIKIMLTRAGFEEIKFSEEQPYWHVIARRK